MGAEGFSEVGGAPAPGSAGVGTKLDVGDVVGDCEILGVEGFGAMGTVYRARQRSLGRTVALKVIRDVFAGIPEYRRRFLREARLAASVNHPHVVSVFDAGEHDGRLYLTMQWVEGQHLGHLLSGVGRLSPGEAVTIVCQLAGALEAIHAAGLVHRDVKPANVVIRDLGGADHAYLTDFGLAKPTDATIDITETGLVLGTPGFMSPEQIEGERPGPRSDLYALGCVAFELFTGERPFQRENELALLMAHVNCPRPLPSEVVAGLGTCYDEFFARALAIDPAGRFASGGELREALRATHAGSHATSVTSEASPARPRSVAAVPVPESPTVRTAPRRRRRWRLALPVLLVAAGASAAALGLPGILARQPVGHSSQTAAGSSRPPPPSRGIRAVSTSGPSARPRPTACGAGLTAGPNTSCGFAINIALAYDRSAGGDTNVAAYSPITGLTYTMHCSGGEPHVCTGGRGASVTFRSGWVSCGQNVLAGPNTSCAFAENVSRAYHRALDAKGPEAAALTRVFSPRTGRTYTVACRNGSAAVTCSTSLGALISFPSP